MRRTRFWMIPVSVTVAVFVMLSAGPANASQPPHARDDYFTVDFGAALRVDGPGVLSNDELAEGDLAVTAVELPYQGRVGWDGTMPKGAFIYYPKPGYVGFDSFTYCLSQTPGSACQSNVATVIIKVGKPAVSRIAGSDRYEGAALVAQQTNPARSGVVFVTSGEKFPDALSAAPAAAKFGLALLLVRNDGVPDPTKREIERLHPAEIIVVGGPASVPDSVMAQLGELAGGDALVSRIGGADRYEVSRAIAAQLFGQAAHSYTATGANYPDALAAGAAAGGRAEPVVLIDGNSGTVDSVTQAAFLAMSTSTITIVGGANSVSVGVEQTLSGISTVNRVSGGDRYDAAVNLARKSVTAAQIAYIATGENYPDALVGGAWAARSNSPLFLSHRDCVPSSVLRDIARIGASDVRLLGGINSLSARVERLEPC